MVEVATVEKQQGSEQKPIGGSEVQRVEEEVEGEVSKAASTVHQMCAHLCISVQQLELLLQAVMKTQLQAMEI